MQIGVGELSKRFERRFGMLLWTCCASSESFWCFYCSFHAGDSSEVEVNMAGYVLDFV